MDDIVKGYKKEYIDPYNGNTAGLQVNNNYNMPRLSRINEIDSSMINNATIQNVSYTQYQSPPPSQPPQSQTQHQHQQQVGFTHCTDSPNKNTDISPERHYQINVDSVSPANKKNKYAEIKNIISDEIGQNLWIETLEDCNYHDLTLDFDDVIELLDDYLTEETKCGHLKFDRDLLLPYFQKIDESFIQNTNDMIITAEQFNNIWIWFKEICNLINQTYYFWSQPIAKNHGFLSREIAEKLLKKSKVSNNTFIVRFCAVPTKNSYIDAKYGALSITYKLKKNSIKHIQLIRINKDNDIFTNCAGKIKQNSNLANWINNTSKFVYVYNGKKKTVQKHNCFR